MPISTEEFLQITSARELAGDTERKITTYIDVAENLCPDSKTKLSAAIDLPKISIRLPAKVAYVKGFERDSSPQTAVYYSICEDSSTPLLSKLPAELESCRDYIKSDNTSNYINTAVLFGDKNIHDLNKDSWRIPIKTIASILQKDPITIDLRDEKIKDSDIEALVSILKEYNITHLTLNTNDKSYKIFKAFISLLKDTNIIHLNLGYNDIYDEEFEMLASILKDTNITHLNLEYNKIGNLGAIELASVLKDTKITKLILDGNLIENKGIKELISIQKNTKIIITFKEQQKETYDSGYSTCEEDIEDYNLQNMEIKGSDIEALVPLLKDSISTHIDLKHNYINTFVEQNLHSVE